MADEKKQLRVVNDFPPNMDAIDAAFNVRGKYGILYAHGETIYNPSGVMVGPELVRHEITHLIQQQELGTDEWWRQYITDPQFRLWQEIPAHQNEFLAHLEGKPNRAMRRRLIAQIAKRLSGPLYGKLISLTDAKQLLDLERIKDHYANQ